jgi:3D (Asp-Asp-Asp) domain-containing protein
MKIRNYKTTDLTISISALIFVVGILIGAFATSISCSKKLNDMQEQLEITQNTVSQYKEVCKTLEDQLQYEYEVNENLELDLAEAMATVANLKSEEYEIIYMGEFKITYYCDELGSHVCGGNGVTASGEQTVVGITAAADWSILPQGSKVYIESVGFREIQDVGGGVKGNHIDVLVETHQDAIDLGTHDEGVWLLVKKES